MPKACPVKENCTEARSLTVLPDARALNPVKHGLFSQARLLPWESQDDRERHATAHKDLFAPRDLVEQGIVDLIDDTSWRLRRAMLVETVLGNVEASKAKQRVLPPEVRGLALENERSELELRLLERLSGVLVRRRRTRDRCPLAGMWLVLDLLVHHGHPSVLDMPVEEVAAALRSEIRGRRKHLEERRAELARWEEALRPEIEAAALEAAMLRPEQHARLLRHVVTLENSRQRAIDALSRIRAIRSGNADQGHGAPDGAGPRLLAEANGTSKRTKKGDNHGSP
jgi:hypothetical protein